MKYFFLCGLLRHPVSFFFSFSVCVWGRGGGGTLGAEAPFKIEYYYIVNSLNMTALVIDLNILHK